MKIEISDELLDQLFVESLSQSMQILQKDIAKLSKKKKLQQFEKEDLTEFVRMYDAMREVSAWYGGDNS